MDSMADDVKRVLNDKFMLRLPDGMRDRIKAAAQANSRSMNAEIVSTLEEKYPEPPPPQIHPLSEHLAYVKAGKTQDEMKERAKERNQVLKEDPATADYVIRVLDDKGERAVGQRVILSLNADIMWVNSTWRPD